MLQCCTVFYGVLGGAKSGQLNTAQQRGSYVAASVIRTKLHVQERPASLPISVVVVTRQC
jgi:hypothetical protein